MSNITKNSTTSFSLVPTTLDEAMKFSDIISKSNFVPKDYKGKPGDILVAVQMGGELGLPPIQALQNIAVINGRPSLWGDAALAVCQNHHKYEYIKETIEESKDGNHKATCIIKRTNEEEYKVTFSVDDAKKAGLWGRQGPWSSYPKRMLQMRARGFALRDKFSDALNGMILREESEDYDNMKPAQKFDSSKNYESKTDMLIDSFEDIQEEKEGGKREAHLIEDEMIKNLIERLYNYDVDDEVIAENLGVDSITDLDDSHVQSITEYGIILKDKYS